MFPEAHLLPFFWLLTFLLASYQSYRNYQGWAVPGRAAGQKLQLRNGPCHLAEAIACTYDGLFLLLVEDSGEGRVAFAGLSVTIRLVCYLCDTMHVIKCT